MIDLISFNAKICFTAAGQVYHDNKLLLVRHRKLNLWLAPGGHLDPEELPHIGAEREVFEETGVKAIAFDPNPLLVSTTSTYIPSPIISNVHWVCEENYQRRLRDGDAYKRDPQWQKGCEQHLGFVYLMRVIGSTSVTFNERESTDIGWFTQEEISALHTTEDLKREFNYGFSLMAKIS